MRSALVSDFDGTITSNDFFSLVAERHMPRDSPDFFEMYRRGQLTHVQAMQKFFDYTPDDPTVLEQLLTDTEPDHDLRSSVERLDRAGWDLIVVSAGSTWYIDRIFSRLGVRATVHSNSGQIVPGKGLQLDDLSRDVDKAGIVREALSKYRHVAFAGDGPPDLKPALLVDPELRFARRYLADQLTRLGERFRPFERWSAVVDALLA